MLICGRVDSSSRSGAPDLLAEGGGVLHEEPLTLDEDSIDLREGLSSDHARSNMPISTLGETLLNDDVRKAR